MILIIGILIGTIVGIVMTFHAVYVLGWQPTRPGITVTVLDDETLDGDFIELSGR